MKLLKKIAIDILGVLLLLGAVAFGWLPGPGGVPLLLAGLGLLAINHTWARNLLEHAKAKGGKLAELFFRDHPLLKLAYDVLALIIWSAAIYLVSHYSNNFIQSAAFILIFVGFGLFLGNRRRLERLLVHIRKLNRKKT